MKRLALIPAIAPVALAIGLGVAMTNTDDTPGTSVANAQAADGERTFGLDKTHSVILFEIRHMTVSNFVGRFNEFDGTFNLDFDEPGNSFMTMTVDPASVDTGNERRDGHLRSNDFFTVKQYPEITFEASGFKKTGENTMEVTGDITYHGVTNEITAELKRVGEGETRQGYKMGVDATFDIDRSAFNDTQYIESGGLGDTVTLKVHLAGVKQ